MPAILTLEKISKRFGAVVTADAVDLTLLRGETLGIVGRNGAGKTTLADIVTGTVAPDAGRVMFEGHDITRMKPEHRCRMGLARAFQVMQPFGRLTVFENVVVAAAFGGGRSENEVYDGCAGLLERCELVDKANQRAAGLAPLDRKRLELARALATGPRVLLLDEIASGLGERETAALTDMINDIRATGVSIIWIEQFAHPLMAVVDRVVMMHGGSLIAEGAPEVVTREPRVAEIYGGMAAIGADADV
jgi:branched-chain amino acid transport system ATP-binding protein